MWSSHESNTYFIRFKAAISLKTCGTWLDQQVCLQWYQHKTWLIHPVFDVTKVFWCLSLKSTKPLALPSSLKLQIPVTAHQGGSAKRARLEAIVRRMWLLVVFSTWGKLAAVKMALLVFPGFPHNFRIIFFKSGTVIVLEAPQLVRFFLSEGTLRNRLNLSTWQV